MRPQLDVANSHWRIVRSSGRRSDRQPRPLHVKIQTSVVMGRSRAVALGRAEVQPFPRRQLGPFRVSNFESFDIGWQRPTTPLASPSARGHASLTRPTAVQDAACLGCLPSSPGAASGRIRCPPIQPPPHQTPSRRESEGTASGNRPDCNCPTQAVHVEGCGGPGWENAAWGDYLHLPEHQDQPDHLLAARTAQCTNDTAA
jgi:hypothetical protein